jgi:hypothetical protein
MEDNVNFLACLSFLPLESSHPHIFDRSFCGSGRKNFAESELLIFSGYLLKYKKNSDLVSRIRSVKIIVEPEEWLPYDTELDGYPLGSKGLKKLMGIDTNPMKTALTIFKIAPIEELVINKSDANSTITELPNSYSRSAPTRTSKL